jgi:DNA primase
VRYDRDELLARTDLAALADELLGYHVGNGRNARWPSPVPDHPQTGRTPPMSIFVDHRGFERWTCFATGANGTAIDLVMVATRRSVGDAIEWLAERARLGRPPPERGPIPRRRPATSAPRGPSTALREYVEACERILWEPPGNAILRWLTKARCLDRDVLRQNRIGADPGPHTLHRPPGLPRRGPAAVFPALDADRRPVYLQARYLHPPSGRGKYDNPTGQHGVNPRLALVERATPAQDGPTIITEGIPDALAVATVGYKALAILGAGLPNRSVAGRVASHGGPLVVAFDSDVAGRSGAAQLKELLQGLGRTDVIDVKPPVGDLNTWLATRGSERMRAQLELSIALAATRRRGRPPVGRSIA